MFKKSVYKDLSQISKEDARRIIDKIEENLPNDADTYPVLKGKFKGLRRMRIGDYRIIFSIIENSVLVLRIHHRRDVHR